MTDKREKPRPTSKLIRAAKNLRKQATFPERLLWSRVRRKQIYQLRFRRQHAIGRYVVDFCCNEVMLIIEVDGDSHVGQKPQDESRQSHLESLGYRVIRIPNDDILHNIDTVVDGVARAVKQAAVDRHPPPTPPSREGGQNTS